MGYEPAKIICKKCGLQKRILKPYMPIGFKRYCQCHKPLSHEQKKKNS